MDYPVIKILYIIDELGAGGTERRFVQLLKGLENKKFSTKTILLGDMVHYEEIDNLDTEVIKLKRTISKDPSIYIRLYRICSGWKPDIIHAWGSMSAVYAGPVAKLLGIKMINAMVSQAPINLSMKLRLRSFFTFPFSDVIQSNSYAALKAYKVPREKGHVIHNGFDFSRINNLMVKSRIKAELNIKSDYIAGMVAGFRHHKDYKTMVLAAKKVLARRKDVSFVFVGDGPELEQIKEMAEYDPMIIFAGRRNDVESIINIFDIGILSTYGESFSNAIMEYMALSKPVIATEGGGTNELVVNGETGFIIAQKSPDLLAEKIDYLLNDENLRHIMGENGRKRIQKEFNIDKMIRRHMKLYRKLALQRGN